MNGARVASGQERVDPTPLAALIREGARLARLHFRSLFPAVAVPVAGATAVLAILQATWLGGALTAGPLAPAGPLIRGLLALLLVVVLTVLIRAVGYAALMAGCVAARFGAEAGGWTSWRRLVPSRVSGTLLLGVVVMALATLLLVLPALYAATLLAFLIPVVLLEGRAGMEALRRSADLVRSHRAGRVLQRSTVRAFLIAVVGGLVAYAANVLTQLPFILAQQVIIWRNVEQGAGTNAAALRAGLLWMQLPAVILGSLVEVAVMLHVGFSLTLLYADVRRRTAGDEPRLTPLPLPAQE
ncbi:MAG: hypothetical protein ACM3O7_01425 [Acidobacteriota bacterium]